MYVVKRPFRNFGKVYTAGTVITEPAEIKRFNGKLAEGKIIVVTEQTFDATAKYFKEKYGVDIIPVVEDTEVKKETKEETEPVKVAKAVAKTK